MSLEKSLQRLNEAAAEIRRSAIYAWGRVKQIRHRPIVRKLRKHAVATWADLSAWFDLSFGRRMPFPEAARQLHEDLIGTATLDFVHGICSTKGKVDEADVKSWLVNALIHADSAFRVRLRLYGRQRPSDTDRLIRDRVYDPRLQWSADRCEDGLDVRELVDYRISGGSWTDIKVNTRDLRRLTKILQERY